MQCLCWFRDLENEFITDTVELFQGPPQESTCNTVLSPLRVAKLENKEIAHEETYRKSN